MFAISRFSSRVLPELTALKWNTEKSRPTWPAEKFIEGARPYRERFRKDGIGAFDAPYVPLNPRTRKVGETDRWTAWDVVLDVWPDVFAWGVIVIPKGIAAGRAASGGRRPARPQRAAARDDRSARAVLQRFRVGARRSRLRRLRAAQSVSRRGSVPLAQSKGQHDSRARCSRSSSVSTSAFSTGSDRCPSSTPIASRSTV